MVNSLCVGVRHFFSYSLNVNADITSTFPCALNLLYCKCYRTYGIRVLVNNDFIVAWFVYTGVKSTSFYVPEAQFMVV